MLRSRELTRLAAILSSPLVSDAAAMSLSLAVILLLGAQTPAATIYKCKLANGSVIYQDLPCSRGTLMKTIVVPSQPKAAPAAVASSTPAPPPEAAAPPAPPQTSNARAQYYKCTSYDDSTYFSASPVPKRHLVPVWVIKNQSLLPPNAAPGSDPRVWVEDQCAEVEVSEACRHYREQKEIIEGQSKIGAGDPKKQVREISRLNTLIKARCGG